MLRSLFARKGVFIGAVLLPIILLIGIFIYYPAVDTFRTSFTNWNLRINRPPQGIGLDNYTRLLADPLFWEVTGRSLVVVGLTLPLEMFTAFWIALLLHAPFPPTAIVRTIVLVPWMVPPVVNGFLWGWLLNGEYGALNGLLYQLGLIHEYHAWLADPHTQVIWIAIVQTWTRFSFPTIVLLAGLQGIPADLFEAATGCGATRRRLLPPTPFPR